MSSEISWCSLALTIVSRRFNRRRHFPAPPLSHFLSSIMRIDYFISVMYSGSSVTLFRFNSLFSFELIYTMEQHTITTTHTLIRLNVWRAAPHSMRATLLYALFSLIMPKAIAQHRKRKYNDVAAALLKLRYWLTWNFSILRLSAITWKQTFRTHRHRRAKTKKRNSTLTS